MSHPRLAYTSVVDESIDHNQKNLLRTIDKYLDLKREKLLAARIPGVSIDYTLPFGSLYGMCSGLEAYWLYSKRMNRERQFIKHIEYASTWDPQNFDESQALEDSYLESLINIISFLHNEQHLLENTRQDNLSGSVNFLFSDFNRQPIAQEFALTFVYTQNKLAEFIQAYCHDNKMVRVDNGFHVVGFIKMGGILHFYDSFSKLGPQEVSDAKKLSSQIFASLTKQCKSNRYLALRITISDLASEPKPKYPDPIDYSKAAMQDPIYKRAVLQHRNIFHLAARYNDYDVLNLLFDQGYKYIPWNLNDDTELNEAVALNDAKEIDYLLDHHVPIEYRTRNGITPFGTAIIENSPELMYKLFQSGADIMREPIRGFTPVELAITYKKAEPLILLLALGADITKEQVINMRKLFGQATEQKITDRALELNSTILKVPTVLDLNKSTGRDIVVFLLHKELANKLGYPIGNIKVMKEGLPLTGHFALQAIADYYESKADSDIFSFPEKVEIYRLLREFDVDRFDFDGNAHLLQLIKQVPKLIGSIKEYTAADLIEISKVLDELTDLSAYKLSFNLIGDMYVSYKARAAKHAIEAILRRNGITDLNQSIENLKRPRGLITSPLFFSVDRTEEPELLSYQSDIAPSLTL